MRVSPGQRPTTLVKCVSVEEELLTVVARKLAQCSVHMVCLPLMTAVHLAQVSGCIIIHCNWSGLL